MAGVGPVEGGLGCLGHDEGAGSVLAELEPGSRTCLPPPLQGIVLESIKWSGKPLTRTSLFHKAETKAQMGRGLAGTQAGEG